MPISDEEKIMLERGMEQLNRAAAAVIPDTMGYLIIVAKPGDEQFNFTLYKMTPPDAMKHMVNLAENLVPNNNKPLKGKK